MASLLSSQGFSAPSALTSRAAAGKVPHSLAIPRQCHHATSGMNSMFQPTSQQQSPTSPECRRNRSSSSKSCRAMALSRQPTAVRVFSSASQNSRGSSDEASSTTEGLPRLCIVDANAMLYRSHFSFAAATRLTTKGGQDTSIEYGFLGSVLGLMEEPPHPTHFAVIFDARGKNFRHELYPGYKGQRTPMPDEIREALPRIYEMMELMGVARFRLDGVEADDVIATLALRGLQAGMLVDIASPDKDFFQLLQPGLRLLRPVKKDDIEKSRPQRAGMVPYTDDRFREEFEGLEPSQFADVLALMGDASDNVPGVKGIGLMTARPLLKEYGDIETLLDNADKVTKKSIREKLMSVEGAAAARLSKKLVLLQDDMDLPPLRIDIDEDLRLRLPEDKGKAILEAFSEMEFAQHSRRLKAMYERGDYTAGAM